MQFLESSVVGLRSAIHTFRHPDKACTITIYPMIHIGDAAFYEDVNNEVAEHDFALLEGLKSPIVNNITRSYRWLNLSRMGLELQSYQGIEQGRVKPIMADLEHEEFEYHWSKIPARLRLAINFLAPTYALIHRPFQTRDRLAADRNRNLLTPREQILDWREGMVPLMRAILHARDEQLCRLLDRFVTETGKEPTRIAIVYGAMHMPAVVRYLIDTKDFFVSDSKWKTVIGL